MSTIELPPEQLTPVQVPETATVQLPLDEVRPETEELDSDKPNLGELGAQLETVAQRVIKRGDAVTAKARLLISQVLWLPVAGFDAVDNSVNELLHYSSLSVRVGMYAGTVGVAIGQAIIDKGAIGKVAPIQIPDGYSVQCLRANEKSLAFDGHEAVAFVHSREYEGDKRQTTDQARDRLRDALTVIEAAPSITKVVLPASLVHEAQVHQRTSKEYGETLVDMNLETGLRSQYEDNETSVVLDREASKRLAEVLQHAHKHPLLNRTIDALAERFPLIQLQLAEDTGDNERLLPLLHTLLRRTLDGELPGAQRERGHENTTYYDRFEPLLTQIDTTNKFDPLIAQHRASNYAVAKTQRLSHMTGDNEHLMSDVLKRLESHGYSDLQLISVALRLAERRDKEKAAEALVGTRLVQANLVIGTDPIAIDIDKDSQYFPTRGRNLLRSLGNIAAAGLAGAFIAHGVAIGMDTYGTAQSSKPSGIINEASVPWRVDEHGMTSAGYYTQNTYDHFNALTVKWDGRDSIGSSEGLPTTLEDNVQAHLTVSGVTNSSDVDLLIRDGTQLGAISAQTKEGQELNLTLYIRGDNTRVVHVENGTTPYKLSYELTPDAYGRQAPFADRALKVTDPSWSDINPSQFPRTHRLGPIHTAALISNTLIYDNSTALRDKLNGEHTSNDYLHAVYDDGRCNCVECATAAALLSEKELPGEKLLLATGYGNVATPGVGHSYLASSEAHAWLVDPNGFILDATAKKIDKNSDVPRHTPTSVMDSLLKDGGWSAAARVADDTSVDAASAANQEKDAKQRHGLEGIALMGLGTLATASLWRELQKRTVTNGVLKLIRGGQRLVNAAIIPPDKAAFAMAWYAYSDGKTEMPTYKQGQSTPLTGNISTDALEKIAQGNLRADQLSLKELRGIQRLAKLVISERRRSEKSTSRKSGARNRPSFVEVM